MTDGWWTPRRTRREEIEATWDEAISQLTNLPTEELIDIDWTLLSEASTNLSKKMDQLTSSNHFPQILPVFSETKGRTEGLGAPSMLSGLP